MTPADASYFFNHTAWVTITDEAHSKQKILSLNWKDFRQLTARYFVINFLTLGNESILVWGMKSPEMYSLINE